MRVTRRKRNEPKRKISSGLPKSTRKRASAKRRVAKIGYSLRFKTSTYAATEIGETLYIGGSNWNRRKVPYTKEIAESSGGILHIMKRGKQGFTVRKIKFPSMIYSLLELPSRLIFVGCKSSKGALNIIDRQGRLVRQRDDNIGSGVYSSVINRGKNEIILATRAGKLEVVDAKTLKLKAQLQLTLRGTRLWSLKFDEKSNVVYAGDYEGMLYAVDRRNFRRTGVLKFDFKTLHKANKKPNQEFGPSVWGLESISENELIAGTRWGDLVLLKADFSASSFEARRQLNLGEDISCIKKLADKIVLVGTRYGKVFSLDLRDYSFRKVTETIPSLQKENAVWGMSSVKGGVLVCFADGKVSKIAL